MQPDKQSFCPDDSPMETINRVLEDLGEGIDRILIVTMDSHGTFFGMYSNARSYAEEHGMACVAKNWKTDGESRDS